jgi:hypothetical protein
MSWAADQALRPIPKILETPRVCTVSTNQLRTDGATMDGWIIGVAIIVALYGLLRHAFSPDTQLRRMARNDSEKLARCGRSADCHAPVDRRPRMGESARSRGANKAAYV